MPDVTGYRAKVAVIIPSTNTVVEADFNDLRIPGVTFHAARMYIERPALDCDAAFRDLLAQVDGAFQVALRDVLTCAPDHITMAMSAPTFWGGAAGNEAFLARARSMAPFAITTGAESCRRALEAFGAKRIAVLTPYQPVMRKQIVRYFEDVGLRVPAYRDLLCPSATAIAQVQPGTLRDAVRELDGDGIDAVVQAGTNLSMVRLADALEAELGKPVIAINAALVWATYRALGLSDVVAGAGRLLREH